jgi:hypothetical protein
VKSLRCKVCVGVLYAVRTGMDHSPTSSATGFSVISIVVGLVF